MNTIKKFILSIVLLSLILLFAKSETDKCIYCGSGSFGYCTKSPYKKHEHIGTFANCVFCGSSAYGYCTKNPDNIHKHGHGDNKCVYCGSKSTGYCSKSPLKVHIK